MACRDVNWKNLIMKFCTKQKRLDNLHLSVVPLIWLSNLTKAKQSLVIIVAFSVSRDLQEKNLEWNSRECCSCFVQFCWVQWVEIGSDTRPPNKDCGKRSTMYSDAFSFASGLIFYAFFAALLGAESITDCDSFSSINPHELSRNRVRVLSQPHARLNENSQQWPLYIADHAKTRELHSISVCFRRKASSGIRIRGTTFPLGR